MATYKLIQDIEAEDKILGPLTLKQFIFALITAFFGYICFLCINSHVTFLLVLFAPPGLASLFFALPFGRDQPTEIWALAKIRFFIKPRRRVWDQSGVKELVTITVPKRVERVLTKNLSQEQVQSRLHTLATTIDSRGWAIKNSNVNMAHSAAATAIQQSDRLVQVDTLSKETPEEEIKASDDMLDEANNPIAKQFDSMITKSDKSRRQQLIDELNEIKPGDKPKQDTSAIDDKETGKDAGPAYQKSNSVPNDYWFLHEPDQADVPKGQSMFDDSQVVMPGANNANAPMAGNATADEAAIVSSHKKAIDDKQQITYAHMRVIQPLGSKTPAPAMAEPPASSETAQSNAKTDQKTDVDDSKKKGADAGAPGLDPAIMTLANNNDLNVATLAREANKARQSQDEVVISLH